MRKHRTAAELQAIRDYARARSLAATTSRRAAFWSVAFTLARRYQARAEASDRDWRIIEATGGPFAPDPQTDVGILDRPHPNVIPAGWGKPADLRATHAEVFDRARRIIEETGRPLVPGPEGGQ